jgi:hypothetical protein
MGKKLLSILLILALALATAVVSYADSDGYGKKTDPLSTKSSIVEDDDSDEKNSLDDVDCADATTDCAIEIDDLDLEIDDLDCQIDDLDSDDDALSETLENEVELLEDEIEALLDAKEEAYEHLQKSYKAAVKAGDTVLAANLLAQIEISSAEFEKLKLQLIATIEAKKVLLKSTYTDEQLKELNKAIAKILKADPKITILGYDCVFCDSADFKFDTPPVIKSGRTVIPVRAITEGFGSELSWDPLTQKVTITKGDTVIVLTIGSKTALVNGVEIPLDADAEMINDRTYVPLRFVLETLKLSVEWNDLTKTIKIDDPAGTL